MRIRLLMLQNFRPFFGRQTLDLTTTDKKPLVLVKALNDVGKTSVFTAIYFCLYGRLPVGASSNPVQELAMHVNRTACAKGDGRTFVKIIFEHKGKTYDITRSIDFKKADPGQLPEVASDELDVLEGGEPQQFKNREEYIDYVNAILPEEASQFFLFDGEDIQKYTRHPPTDDVRHAIEMVLGIRELLNAREDLEYIEQDLSRELNKTLTRVSNRSKEAMSVEALGQDIETLQAENRQLEIRMDSLTQTKESCDKELAKDQAIQSKVSDRTNEEEQLKNVRNGITANAEEKRDFNRHMAILIANPLLEELAQKGVTQVPHWKRDAIAALLSWESDRCLCDREITPEIREFFEEYMEKHHGERPVEFFGDLATQLLLKTDGKALGARFYELESQKANLEASAALYEGEVEKLNKEIGDQKDLSSDIKSKESTRTNAANEFIENKRKRDENNGKISEKRSELERRRSRLLDEEQMNNEVKLANKHLKSCRDCKNATVFAIDSLIDQTRREVQQLASAIFVDNLTNNPKLYRGIEVLDNFELRIRTAAGTTLPVWIQDPSAGQSQIIATSFIAALNRYTAREAPVVIDTPIGRLDPIHKKNLLDYFPKIGHQVLILYQPNELTESDLALIGKHVSSEWIMSRDPVDPAITIISKED